MWPSLSDTSLCFKPRTFLRFSFVICHWARRQLKASLWVCSQLECFNCMRQSGIFSTSMRNYELHVWHVLAEAVQIDTCSFARRSDNKQTVHCRRGNTSCGVQRLFAWLPFISVEKISQCCFNVTEVLYFVNACIRPTREFIVTSSTYSQWAGFNQTRRHIRLDTPELW